MFVLSSVDHRAMPLWIIVQKNDFVIKLELVVFAQGQILCISPNGLQASHGINLLWFTIYLTFDKMLH